MSGRELRERDLMLLAARRALASKRRILGAASAATIEFRGYDPCRAVQPVAVVRWPGVLRNDFELRPAVFEHVTCDGDAV